MDDTTAIKNKCKGCGLELTWSEFSLFKHGILWGPFCVDCYQDAVEGTLTLTNGTGSDDSPKKENSSTKR